MKLFSLEISVVFRGCIMYPIKNHRYFEWIHRRQKDTHPLKYDDIIRSRETLDSFVSPADTTVGISCVPGYFSSPYLRDDDRCRMFSFSFTPSAYILHDRHAFSIRFFPSFLPSTTIQPKAIAGAIPTSYWLRLGELVRVRRSAVGRTFAIPANASYVVSMEMKRHRRHIEIISPSSIVVPRARNNFSTSLYHSARKTSLEGRTTRKI